MLNPRVVQFVELARTPGISRVELERFLACNTDRLARDTHGYFLSDLFRYYVDDHSDATNADEWLLLTDVATTSEHVRPVPTHESRRWL